MSHQKTAWAALLALALVLTGCGTAVDGGARSSTRPDAAVSPADFAVAVRNPATVTVNVHVPDEGSIAGTDLTIPFDQLRARRAELPSASTPLALYCRTGGMSATAVRTLAALGFRRVIELDGGMVEWTDSGRSLLPRAGVTRWFAPFTLLDASQRHRRYDIA